MGEKLSALIALYNQKADENLAKSKEKLDSWTSAREEAISIDFPLSDTSYGDKTFSNIGELIEAIFLEDGGFNNDIYRALGPSILFGSGDDIKSKVRDLYKVRNANQKYKHAEDIKNQDPVTFFENISSSFNSTIAKQSSLSGTNPKSLFNDIVNDEDSFEEIMDMSSEGSIYPSGVISSSELREALIEQGNNLSSSGTPNEDENANPINETDEVANDEEGEFINPEETEKEVQEDVSVVESSNAALDESLETPSETSTESIETNQLPDENVSGINETTPETNISETKESNYINEATINNSQIDSTENIENISNPSLSDIKSDESISIINETNDHLNKSSNYEESNISSNDSNLSTSINTVESKDNFLQGGNTFNLSSVFSSLINDTGDTSSITKSNEVFNESTNINPVESNSNISIENSAAGDISNISSNLEVSKSKIGLDKKVAPLTKPEIIPEPVKDNSGIKITETSSNETTSPVKKEEIKSEPAANVDKKEPKAGGVNNFDVSSLERRLKNIESLLMGPLDVRLVD